MVTRPIIPQKFKFAAANKTVGEAKSLASKKVGQLPGFDPDQYLEINEDVAAAGVDPLTHYLANGRAELRTVFSEGERLRHVESRAMSDLERKNWVVALNELTKSKTIESLIADHPRAGWLLSGFTLAGYLIERSDIAAIIPSPLYAAYHYLEFGLEDGTFGVPVDFDLTWVEEVHKVGLPDEMRKVKPVSRELLTLLFKKKVSAFELVLEESHSWELEGFAGPQMAEIFDHEYYHAMASQAGSAPRSFDRSTCIRHFIDKGMMECFSINPKYKFDPAFYHDDIAADDMLSPRLVRKAKADLDKADEALIYAHWLKRGLRTKMAPNLQVWAKDSLGLELTTGFQQRQLHQIILASPLQGEASARQVLRYVVENPLPALGGLDLAESMNLELVIGLADQFAIAGENDKAEGLYWLALGAVPNHGRTLRHLADHMQRRGAMSMVHSLRNKVPVSDDSPWNTLAVAEASMTYGRNEDAAEHLAKLPERHSDVVIGRKRKDFAQKAFLGIWNNISRYVNAFGIEDTQKQLRAALNANTPDFQSVHRDRNVTHIALVGNMDIYQCKLYRVDQKAEQLRKAGYTVSVYPANTHLSDFVDNVDAFQAVIFFRVPAFPSMIDAIVAAAQHGLLTFYEIDDVVFDTAHFPPSFESYAGQIDETQYAAMACGVPLFEHAMKLCDYGITSTATIKTLMEKTVRTGRVFEHHNALSRVHAAAIRQNEVDPPFKPSGSPLVLFYGSGTKAHKEDFHDILEPALAEIVRRYPKRVEVRLIGHFGDFAHLDLKKDPVTILEPVWNYDEYCSHLAEADINLSVLDDSLLTDAKSEIKWMEAAMFGVPSVVSNTATHRETIEDGVDGFLAKTPKEFSDAIERLVKDPNLRMTVGATARDVVMERYSLSALGQNLRSIFEELRPEVVKKPRLMIVNVFYPPQSIGGATRVVYDNVKELIAHYGDRYEIDIVCTLEGGSVPFEVDSYAMDGVRVWSITAEALEGGDMQTRNPRMEDAFGAMIDKIGPDLIHYHCVQRLTGSAVEAARQRDVPYLITLHDGWWISPNQFLIDDRDEETYYSYAKAQTKVMPDRAKSLVRLLRGAQHLLAVSSEFQKIHETCGLENVITVENGVTPLPTVPRSLSASGRVRLAHIGGAVRQKGVHLVRNALLSTPYSNLELLLIDHAMPSGTTRSEVWGTTPVTIMGKVPQAEVADLYSKIDILLAPSIWPESYGLVTREASTSGAWVIASDRGAIGGDVVEGENGHRVDVATYKGLAGCLKKVDADHVRYLSPPEKQPHIRKVRDQVDETVKVYDEVLARAVGRAG